jgi:ABC-2 type transport system permease protein
MLTQLLAIARAAFVESVRQPILFVLVLLSGLLQVFNTWNTGYTLADTESSQVSGDTKLLFDVGLATIFVIGTLLAGFIATAVISREIENKTVLTIVSKPVGRPVVVLGKFIGVAGAILASVVVMLVFLMLAIRHGVMSTAAHEIDGPVLLFGLGFVFVSLALAGWCNYFYGWNFPQTFMSLLVPLSLVAYVCVLLVNKNWQLQSITTDFKDQVLIASLCLGMAIVVLTSVALAASTRLGQVATVFVCFGVFLAALLSHYFVGRHVFRNEPIALISKVEPEDASRPAFSSPGDYCRIELTRVPTRFFETGARVFFSPSPSGYPLLFSGSGERFAGNVAETREALDEEVAPGIVVASAEGSSLRLRRIGTGSLPMLRPPEAQDYLFLKPTTINGAALAVWGVVPNLQFFWLLDAVSQNRPVPGLYLSLISLYTVCQAGIFLSLAVILFQRRDVG